MSSSSEALDVTIRFLRTKGAVAQALCMAKDEMVAIGEADWKGEVWGAMKTTTTNIERGKDGDGDGGGGDDNGNGKEWKVPWLFFWFAGEDHWVARETREEVLVALQERFGDDDDGDDGDNDDQKKEDRRDEKRRANRRPVVVVDENDGLVHAWCLSQSELVAARVRDWVGDILREIGV